MKSIGKTLILIVVILLISQSLMIILKTYETVDSYQRSVMPATAKAAVGVVELCINSQPDINISNCNGSATQGQYYECWLNATDVTYYNFTYYSEFIESYRAFNNTDIPVFNVSRDGLVNFTPTNNDVGNYTILFTVEDGVGCGEDNDTARLDLFIANVNDPPYLIRNIPDQTIQEAEVLHAFYLDSYFADPDLDDLNYSVILTNSGFVVNIDPITSEVVISSTVCDITGFAMFIAEDPYGETNESNLVSLKCVSPGRSPDTGEGAGGGGGGGGGMMAPCISEYTCFDYYMCRRNNTKIQRCIDAKGCQLDVYLTVPCKYEERVACNESWNCSAWAPCLPNGTQTRTCFDANQCETELNKPVLVQDCEYIGTCEDNIKSCHDGSCEEGIDCGGPCAPCKSIEVPYPFQEEKGILIYIITGIILLLLTAILLYHYFRKEINAALAKAGWIITRRKKKQLLLSVEDKRKLLADIHDAERKMFSVALFETVSKYSEALRFYLTKACNDKLSPEFDVEELKTTLEKQKVRIIEILRKIFIAMFDKYMKVEKDKSLITQKNLAFLFEELRNMAIQTSKVEPEDLAREIKEISLPEKAEAIEKMILRITNAYIALEYLELEVSKKKYLEILTEYDKLNIKEQELIFEDISKLYHNITYVNSWLAKPKVD